MALNLSITFPCKPYVRCFIEQNYGIPIRFYRDKGLMTIIRLLLSRQDSSDDYRPINPNIYCDKVTFHINEHDYNHYGGIFSNRAIMDINLYFEGKVKLLMRSWISAQHTYGMAAIEAVKQFQDVFGYPENVWKAESIYKDCQRNGVFDPEPRKLLKQEIHKIILCQMSKNRTVTKLGLSEYNI